MRPFRRLIPPRRGGAFGLLLLVGAGGLGRLFRPRVRAAPAGGPGLVEVADNLPGLIYRHVLHADGSSSYPFLAGCLPGIALDPGGGPSTLEALMRRIGAAQAAAWRPTAEAGTAAPFRLELPVGGRWLRSVARLRHRGAGPANPAGVVPAELVWDGLVLDVTDLKQAEARLAASVTEKEVLLGEIHHRVYNNLQVVWSLLKLESRDAGHGEARTRLDRIANLIAVLGRIHHQLYASRDFTRIDVATELRRLAETLALEAGRPPLPVEAEPLHCDMDTAVPLLLAACELVSAALRCAPEVLPGALPEIAAVRFARAAGGEVRLVVRSAGTASESLSALGRNLVEALCMQIDAVAVFRASGEDGGEDGGGGEVASVAIPGQRFVD